MVRPVDADKLIAFLEERAAEPPVEAPSMLVRYAMYKGLAERIRGGEFNIEEGK